MTIEELSQLYFLKKELEKEKVRLNELLSLRGGSSMALSPTSFGKSISDKTGELAASISDLREMIDENIKRCFDEMKKISSFIYSIENSEIRLIMSLRFINGMTWQQISFNIGYQDESTPRKRLERFIKKNSLEEKN